jgi:hypothetical protein
MILDHGFLATNPTWTSQTQKDYIGFSDRLKTEALAGSTRIKNTLTSFFRVRF